MSKRRFFIIGKGSGSVMRHLTVNVGGGHGSLLVNGELVTLNENNNYEGDFTDGTQIELETVAGTGYNFEGWYNDSEDLWPGGWNYDNPTTFTLDANYSLELHFAEMFNVVVKTSLDPSYGYITVNGVQGNFSDTVADGSELTLQAVEDNTTGDGRRVWFSYWYDGSSYNYANPTTYTVNNDVTIDAGFGVDHFIQFIVDPTKYSIVRRGQTMTQTFTDAFISGSSEKYEVVCETGYQFDGWLVDGVLDSDTSNPKWFGAAADRTVEPSVSAVAPVTQPNDELWYTTSNNQTVTPYSNSFGSRSILTNTYSDGKGIIKFDGNLVEIGYEAFNDCNTLTTVSFPDTVTNIADHAFDGCHMSTLNLNHITSIGSEAFDLNDQTTLNIPQYVTSITDNPFRSQHGNLTITVDANNSNYTDGGGNNCVYDPLNNKLITGGPNTVIPSGCTTIGDWAFSECYSLTSIEIPASVTRINQFAFACDNTGVLQELIVHSNPSLVHECFMNQATGGVLKYTTGVDPSQWLSHLPSGWTAIIVPPNDEIWYETSDNQTADFSNTNFNANITSNTYSNGKGVVKFDNNVTSTSDGYGSPSTATNLTKIWFPDSFTTVGNYSFMKCPLTYVSFNNITTIGYRAFDFNEITSLYIPPALSSIGNMGLRGKYLTNITVNPNNQTFNDGINDNGSNCIYDTLNGTLVLGCVNTVIPDSCTEIGKWAFSSNKLLTTIDFKQATQINGWAADFDINELSGPALETIYIRSTTPATFENTDVFDNQKTNGILYYESGVDYQRWLDVLPSGWTAHLIS